MFLIIVIILLFYNNNIVIKFDFVSQNQILCVIGYKISNGNKFL